MSTAVGTALRAARAVRLRPRPAAHSAEAPARTGPTLSPGCDPEGLTSWQAAKAESRLAAIRLDDRLAVQRAMSGARPADRPHLRRAVAAGSTPAQIVALATLLADRPPEWARTHLRLVDDEPGVQCRFGARIDQVDATACGSAVLLVLASAADPALALALTAPVRVRGGADFGVRFDQRQLRTHRESNRVWPMAWGTSPRGMVRWLARYGAGVGPYRVRAVDDDSASDFGALVREVSAELADGNPVPLLIGTAVPRHYVLALGRTGTGTSAGWHVYEPCSGEVRVLPPAGLSGPVGERGLAALLGYARVHAALLPGR